MARPGSMIAALLLVTMTACTAAAPSPSPTAAPVQQAASRNGTPTPATWGETNLPASARPGASSDDSSDDDGEQKKTSKTLMGAPLATPRVVPTASTPILPPGVVQDIFVSGLALDPACARNHYFYVFYSQTVEGKNEPHRNRIVRFTELDGKGTNETLIFDNLPIGKPSPENLNGGRIGFGPDGKLYVTVGDTARRSEAKKARSLFGKILRLNADGSIPSDNPDPQEPVFATGVRSPFGLDFQPGTGLPWVSDNGPQGDDEINRIVMGGNFGWPGGSGKIGKGDGNWIDPVWDSGHERYGPPGLAFYTGNAVPEWRNDLFFCDWNTGSLWRLNLQPPNYATVGEKEVVAQPCRLYVRSGPDGALYFSDHHAIYRLGPPRT